MIMICYINYCVGRLLFERSQNFIDSNLPTRFDDDTPSFISNFNDETFELDQINIKYKASQVFNCIVTTTTTTPLLLLITPQEKKGGFLST